MHKRGACAARAAAAPELKRELLKLCANTDRGKSADDTTSKQVLKLIEELEQLNPTPDPASSSLVSGKWSLLYTGSTPEDSEERARREGAVGSLVTEVTGAASPSPSAESAPLLPGGDPSKPKPLGRTITTSSGSFIENKGNFQDIDAEGGKVQNRAELSVFGTPCSLRIDGSCRLVPAEETGGEAVRLAVAFIAVELWVGAGAEKPILRVPLGWANGGKGPQGFVDTTYLDSELRLGRGDKGSVFVTARRAA